MMNSTLIRRLWRDRAGAERGSGIDFCGRRGSRAGDSRVRDRCKGKNGFVCFVERSWANHIDGDDFWNPRMRAPNCYNAPAVRTVLPPYLARTEWVLAGASKPDLVPRTKAAIANKEFVAPEPGSLSYMMSVQGHLNDADGHWHPHVSSSYPGQRLRTGARICRARQSWRRKAMTPPRGRSSSFLSANGGIARRVRVSH
jgi:hypothetical protein